MKRAIIVHGFKGKPDTNWKPWLKQQLELNDFSVNVPEMPNTDNPLVDEWVRKLSETVGSFGSDEIYLIGHSLGCITVLKYLETLSQEQKVKLCVFVAGFGRRFDSYQGGHDSFFEQDLDWDKIVKHSDNLIAIHSRDDPSVGYKELTVFEDKLNAKTILLDDMGHFSSQDGVFAIPVVLSAILELK